MSVNDTDPALLFGGTWERIEGRFLLAASDKYEAGSTGGEATHKLTVAEMPNHSHTLGAYMGGAFSTGSAGNLCIRNQNTGTAGGNNPHNNMPPYLVVYMWQRVS